MGNHVPACNLGAKKPRVKTLTEQFEELQRLRDQVRRAEAKAAKAVHAWRYQRRRKGQGYDSSLRSGGRTEAPSL
jgi:hypothetical protein